MSTCSSRLLDDSISHYVGWSVGRSTVSISLGNRSNLLGHKSTLIGQKSTLLSQKFILLGQKFILSEIFFYRILMQLDT